MAHGEAREGKWRGNWRMEWVANTLHTTSEHGVSSITTAVAHISAASSRLNWSPPLPADLNGLVHFGERRNLVSARVPSRFKRSLPIVVYTKLYLLMMDLDTPETCRCRRNTYTKNKLCIKLGFSLHKTGEVSVTIAAVEHNKYFIFWVCVCSLNYSAHISHAPYCIAICSLSGCTVF